MKEVKDIRFKVKGKELYIRVLLGNLYYAIYDDSQK